MGTRTKNGERRCAFRAEHTDLLVANPDRKWKIRYPSSAPGYFVLENIGRSGKYMKSPGGDKPITIKSNTYPEGNDQYLWKASGSESSFTLKNKRYGKYMYI